MVDSIEQLGERRAGLRNRRRSPQSLQHKACVWRKIRSERVDLAHRLIYGSHVMKAIGCIYMFVIRDQRRCSLEF